MYFLPVLSQDPLHESDAYRLLPDGLVEGDALVRLVDKGLRIDDPKSGAQTISTTPPKGSPNFTCSIPLIEGLYGLSLRELAENRRGEGGWNAGAEWHQNWTRDTAYSVLLSLDLIDPEEAKSALAHRVRGERLLQDPGTGGAWPISTDRMVWIPAAWNVFLSTGDHRWLAFAYEVGLKALAEDEHTVFDPKVGLFRGETSFLDWRAQSYPAWMDPVAIGSSFSLSTNITHWRAYEMMVEMARWMRKPVLDWQKKADALRKAIDKHFWYDQRGRYAMFLYPEHYTPCSSVDSLGTALCLHWAMAPTELREPLFDALPWTTYGLASFRPQLADVPAYHNNSVWPFVTAFGGLSAAKLGKGAAYALAWASLTRAAARFGTHKENMVASTGDPDGTLINSDRQLWSVAGWLGLLMRGIFGLETTTKGLHFSPYIPRGFEGTYRLEGYKLRGNSYDIEVTGTGRRIKSFTVNGKAQREPILPWEGLRGTTKVHVELVHSQLPQSAFAITETRWSPPAPTVEETDKGIKWNGERGETYRLYKDGQFLQEQTGKTYALPKTAKPGNYQVRTFAKDGTASFLSAPYWHMAERVHFDVHLETMVKGVDVSLHGHGLGYVKTTASEYPTMSFVVEPPRAGTYRVVVGYANGCGNIETGSRCALRTLWANGQRAGTWMLPHRGAGNWTDWGLSNALLVRLQAGENRVEITLNPEDQNMDPLGVNEALLGNLHFLLES